MPISLVPVVQTTLLLNARGIIMRIQDVNISK